MKSSTKSLSCQEQLWALLCPDSERWSALLRYVPDSIDLEASARDTGALLRRREVKSASDLLRLVLGYSECDRSLRLLGIHSVIWELGNLSKTALRKRLQRCVRWLGRLIMALLEVRRIRMPTRPGIRLRLVDATVISEPGSQGTNWRVHLSLDLGQRCLAGVEITDAHGAETLARFPTQTEEIRVADRGYAFANGLGPVLEAGGRVVVRINWHNLPLEDANGGQVDVACWLRELERSPFPVQERTVWLSTPQGRFAMRLVAGRLPTEKAAEARRRARKTARKNKHRVPDPRTLLAAGFVLVLTNLPADWSAQEILELYRFRWQVEMHIKRLKSLLSLDGLRARDPHLAQAYLLGKILGVLFLEEMTEQIRSCALPGWDTRTRPISPWRMMALCHEVVKQEILGVVSLARIIQVLPRLHRFLADEPRRRVSQLAVAETLLKAPADS